MSSSSRRSQGTRKCRVYATKEMMHQIKMKKDYHICGHRLLWYLSSFTSFAPGMPDGKVNSGSVTLDSLEASEDFEATDVAGGVEVGLVPADVDNRLDLRLQ
jgi:hypothetical protein